MRAVGPITDREKSFIERILNGMKEEMIVQERCQLITASLVQKMAQPNCLIKSLCFDHDGDMPASYHAFVEWGNLPQTKSRRKCEVGRLSSIILAEINAARHAKKQAAAYWEHLRETLPVAFLDMQNDDLLQEILCQVGYRVKYDAVHDRFEDFNVIAIVNEFLSHHLAGISVSHSESQRSQRQ